MLLFFSFTKYSGEMPTPFEIFHIEHYTHSIFYELLLFHSDQKEHTKNSREVSVPCGGGRPSRTEQLTPLWESSRRRERLLKWAYSFFFISVWDPAHVTVSPTFRESHCLLVLSGRVFTDTPRSVL